jgi:heat shock protein HslJ
MKGQMEMKTDITSGMDMGMEQTPPLKITNTLTHKAAGRKRTHAALFGLAVAALMLLGACTFTVQPESGQQEAGQTETGASDATAATPVPSAESEESEEPSLAEFVLPDGTSCLFAGTGATVAFDDKRVNYSCTPLDASDNATQTLAILNDPFVVGPTEYSVDLATIAHTDAGFELHASEVISYTAWEIVLADGRVCLHAGFGATIGFDGKRLNYTCDKGDSAAQEVGLMGELVNQGEGVWMAQIDEIDPGASGFVQLSSTQVSVAKISGAEVQPGAESASVEEPVDMSDELIGITWQWIQTEYGDGSVEVAADPSRYTLYFDDTGQVAATFDCNGGGGSYTVDGSTLTFGALVTTLMACPDGSQDAIFGKDLAEVYSYVIQDGHLFLSMKLDTGIMEFAPADSATAEPEGEGTDTEDADSEGTDSEEAGMGGDLAGTSWQWQQSIYEGDMVVSSNDPSRYTLTFNEDGTLQHKSIVTVAAAATRWMVPT